MQIETQISIKSNTDVKKVKVQAEQSNGIIIIKKLSIFHDQRFIDGDFWITWFFMFDKVYTETEFELLLQDAITQKINEQ